MTPIELNFYNTKAEITRTFVKPHITWGDFKAAMTIREEIAGIRGSEMADRIKDFMVAFFDGAFSRAEMEKKAAADDVMACFFNIIAQCDQAVSEVSFQRGTTSPSPNTTTNP